MDLKRIIGQCAPLFFMAVTFDVVGFILMLVGLAASPRIGERVYGDFLALTGAILMFFGLGMWVMWYAGNIGADGKRVGFRRLTRKLSERMSSIRMSGKSGKYQREEEEEAIEQELEEKKVEKSEVEEEDEKKCQEEEEEVKKSEEAEEEVKKSEGEEEEVKKSEGEEEEVKKSEGEEERVETNEAEDEGKSEKDDACYINEAYEPTESDTV